jgi:hypothetical protein
MSGRETAIIIILPLFMSGAMSKKQDAIEIIVSFYVINIYEYVSWEGK